MVLEFSPVAICKVPGTHANEHVVSIQLGSNMTLLSICNGVSAIPFGRADI